HVWSASLEQTGATVTASNLDWNATVEPGASVTFGFIGVNRGPTPCPDCSRSTEPPAPDPAHRNLAQRKSREVGLTGRRSGARCSATRLVTPSASSSLPRITIALAVRATRRNRCHSPGEQITL